MLGQCLAVFACQHQHVFLVRTTESHIDTRAGEHRQRFAQLALNGLLLDPPPLRTWRQVIVKVALRTSAAPRGMNGSDPEAPRPPPYRPFFTLRISLHDIARLLGNSQCFLEGAAGGRDKYTWVCDKVIPAG